MIAPADLVWERRVLVARFVLAGLAIGAAMAASEQLREPIGLLAGVGVLAVAVIVSWPWRLQHERARERRVAAELKPGGSPFWGWMAGLVAGQIVFGSSGFGVAALYGWSLGLWGAGLWATRRQIRRFPAPPEVDHQ